MISIGFLLFPNVQQLDFTGPYEVFASWRQANIHLVWKDTAPLLASTGLRLSPTTGFADCPPLDVICVPGGSGINPLLADDEVLDFLRARAAEARYVTSVCTGALVLGAAGLLAGKRATTHWACLDLLASFGAVPTHGRVVRDGNLVTGGGVTAGIDFALTLVADIAGPDAAEAIQLFMEYAPEPPFDSGSPESASPAILAAVKERGAALRMERERLVRDAAARLKGA